jgi:hypothetical protein
MSSSKKKQTVGWRYRLGMHMGLCEGPVDALLQLRSAERVAWSGSVTANGTITVDAPTIFGGDEREGGLAGDVDVMMGGSSQTANSYLSGLQGTPQPAYRGMLGLVFKAFYWGNSPYLKPIAALVRRLTAGWEGGSAWYPEKAAISLGVSVSGLTFAEDFAAWPQAYTIVDEEFFSLVSTPYGTGLKVTNVADTTDDGSAIRAVPSAQYTTISFKATIDVNASGAEAGDADIVFLAFSQGSTDGIVIALSRDATGTGSSEKPSVNGVAVGSAPLVVGEWYLFTLTLDWGAGSFDYEITNLTTPAAFASGSGTISGGITAIDRIAFGGDIAPGERLDDAGTVAGLSMAVASEIIGANPAHVIYECLTNSEWGAGNGTGLIDDTQFRAAADTFYSEGLGICLHWTQQEQIERFMQLVIDHAGANLVQHPRTGLFQLKPLRGGYDPSSLPLFDQSNIVALESFERPSPDEAVNEIAVTYTDTAAGPGKKATVKAQNLAAIMAAGAVITRKKDYPGFVSPGLAMRAAMRDLRASSTTLAKARLRVNRAAYTLVDGDLLRLSWPKLGITALVMRVLRVSYGSATDATMTLEVAEDVFGLPAATYAAQQPSGWQSPNTAPAPATLRLVREANYYEAQLVLGSAAAQALDETTGFVIAASARSGSAAALDFGMRTRAGSAAFEERDRSAFAPSGTLSASLSYTATSATVTGLTDASLVQAGRYAQIDAEIVRVDSFDSGTGALTMGRGVLGTVADEHASDARVWFVDQFFAVDGTERVDGDAVDVKVLPRTGQGELAEVSAATDSVTLDSLIARPYAPGQMRIDGNAYPSTVDAADFEITWKHRHRLQQNLEGDESGDIGPEAGTTYTVELTDADDDTALHTETGITGTSYTVQGTDIDFDRNVRVRLWAVRAGLASAQRHDVVVEVTGVGAVVGSAWNPSDKDADVSLSSGDTVASITAPAAGAVRGTQGRDAGDDHYFEVTIGGAADGRVMVGIGQAGSSLIFPGYDGDGRGYWGNSGHKYVNNAGSSYGATFTTGDVIGVRLNAGDLTFYKNGTSQGVAYSGLTGTWYPSFGTDASATGTRTGAIETLAPDNLPSGSTAWG